MAHPTTTVRHTGRLAAALCAGIVACGAGGAAAQQPFDGQSSIYVDGSTPVDSRTRALVDAYMDQLDNERRARAEERERFDRFIHHDNVFGLQQQGRY